MLASYIAKQHWLAHLQDAWIVERTGGRRRGHCVQVRDPSLLALSPYLVPFGLTADAGALCPLVCARLSTAWVDEAMRFIVQTNLNWMIRLLRRLWYKFFVLQTYLSHDFRFFIAMWKKYGTLFLEVHLQSEKSPWPGSLSWFIQKGIQLPAYHSCFVVGLWSMRCMTSRRLARQLVWTTWRPATAIVVI